MSDILEKLTKAKSRLVNKQPFFAHLVLGLPLVEADWLNPQTMATDMERIYFHPKFVEEHSVTELMGVLSHEAMHVAYLHGLRRGTRDHLLWNVACDFAINLIVLDAGLELPKNRLLDEKYRDWSAQDIYSDLEKNAIKINVSFPANGKPQDGDGQGSQGDGNPMWGGVMDPQQTSGSGDDEQPSGKALSQADIAQLEQELKVKVQQAAEAAKARGNLPAGVEGLIKAIGAPKINWKDYIQQWVSGHTPDNYTWSRPNRSMLVNHRVYMPRMQLNGAGIGLLSIDTSGSVSDKELVEYITEITGVIEICNPDKLHIIQHDAVIQRHDIWEHGMDFKDLKVKGRGGTCIQPSFKWAEQCDDVIDWMICFTDMGIGDYPKISPSFPVLWAATGPDNAPFGTYIPLKDAI